jgi:organic radical activating enzyme|tara:strand:- start:3735 stop:4718 length:984 start_codon:yes stop_codon:yes gene_type:complete
MSELIAIKQTGEPFVNITWQVSNLCNFRCTYCNESNWNGRNLNLDVEAVKEGLTKLIDYELSQGYTRLKVFFSGGEPCYWKPLVEVMDHILASGMSEVKFAINTNLSSKMTWWEDNVHYFDDVVASYHPEYVNDDHYLSVYKYLSDKVNYLCGRMMMHEPTWDKVISFSNRIKQECTLENYNWRVEYVPIFEELSHTTAPYNYKNPEHKAFLETNSLEQNIISNVTPKAHGMSSEEVYDDGTTKAINCNRLVAEGNNFFKGWTCMIPSESIFINCEGHIDMGSCGVLPRVGNLYDKDLVLHLPDNVICPKNHCHCGTDIYITKYKNA